MSVQKLKFIELYVIGGFRILKAMDQAGFKEFQNTYKCLLAKRIPPKYDSSLGKPAAWTLRSRVVILQALKESFKDQYCLTSHMGSPESPRNLAYTTAKNSFTGHSELIHQGLFTFRG